MGRRMFAVIGGIVIGVVLLGIIQGILQAFDPPETQLDYTDPEVMAKYIEGLPAWRLLLLLLGFAAGAFSGGFAGSRISDSQTGQVGFIIGVGLTVFTLINLVQFPYPLWFIIAGVLLNIPMAVWGARLGSA